MKKANMDLAIMKGLALSLIVIFMFFATSSGYKFYLSQYQEECYQYATQIYVANYTYQDWKDGSKCISQMDWWNLDCSIVTKYIYFNSTRFTDECVKYHLVRYETN